MAQEKGKEAKEGKEAKDGKDYEFIPPDFDEDAFIHKEMVSFRTTVILFLWGIVAALVSWAAFGAVEGAKIGWLIGLGIAAAFGVSLKWIYPALKVDIRHFARREWLGTAALFFFTWLAFFLITINPPLSDFAPPRVDLHAAPFAQEPDGNVTVHLFVEDNVKVDSHTFRLLQGTEELADEGSLQDLGRGHYTYTATDLSPGTYRLEATAVDDGGHEGEGSLEFAVSEGIVDYSASAGGLLTGAADRVLVTTGDVPACKTSKGQVTTRAACIRTVRLEMAGLADQVTLKYDKDEKSWVGTTALAGWHAGNNTFDVVAEFADQYDGSVLFDGGAIRQGPYTATVTGTLGTEVVVPARDPPPHQRSVPGLELPLLAAGLLALAIAARRRD